MCPVWLLVSSSLWLVNVLSSLRDAPQLRKAVQLVGAGPSPSAVPAFPEDVLGRVGGKVLLRQERGGCVSFPQCPWEAALWLSPEKTERRTWHLGLSVPRGSEPVLLYGVVLVGWATVG